MYALRTHTYRSAYTNTQRHSRRKHWHYVCERKQRANVCVRVCWKIIGIHAEDDINSHILDACSNYSSRSLFDSVFSEQKRLLTRYSTSWKIFLKVGKKPHVRIERILVLDCAMMLACSDEQCLGQELARLEGLDRRFECDAGWFDGTSSFNMNVARYDIFLQGWQIGRYAKQINI